MDDLATLKQVLDACEYIYLNATAETVKELKLYISQVKDLVVFRNSHVNDAYPSIERPHQDWKPH